MATVTLRSGVRTIQFRICVQNINRRHVPADVGLLTIPFITIGYKLGYKLSAVGYVYYVVTVLKSP